MLAPWGGEQGEGPWIRRSRFLERREDQSLRFLKAVGATVDAVMLGIELCGAHVSWLVQRASSCGVLDEGRRNRNVLEGATPNLATEIRWLKDRK